MDCNSKHCEMFNNKLVNNCMEFETPKEDCQEFAAVNLTAVRCAEIASANGSVVTLRQINDEFNL